MHGATHGQTRITRPARGKGPIYTRFTKRSQEIWRELETTTNTQLPTQNGLLRGHAIRTRFPAFNTSSHDEIYFEPKGAFLHPERCVIAQLAEAAKLGASLQTFERVRSLKSFRTGVIVTTNKATYWT